jgi:CBS-domain-containing membrane protein
MGLSWREMLDRARRTVNRHTLIAGAVAGMGAAIAIGAMEFFSLAARYPLAVIPFATSIVLVIGSPEAEPAQPRALIGGHVVATVVGLIVLGIAGPHVWSAAAAVGLAVLAMFLTGTFHPPAGINPLLVVSNNLSWPFLIAPVFAGAVLLTAFAFVWHRWIGRRPWPRHWI